MLRKILRNIARNKMHKEGLTGINRKPEDLSGKAVGKSFFAVRWREYVGLQNKAIRQKARNG